MSNIERTPRLNELVKRALSRIIQTEFAHSGLGWATISRVAVSKDMQHARVFFTARGGEEEEKKSLTFLKDNQPKIRFFLGKTVHLRYTPKLIFEIDSELKKALKLDSIIDKASELTDKHDYDPDYDDGRDSDFDGTFDIDVD